jgi:molecular chaperone DnaK
VLAEASAKLAERAYAKTAGAPGGAAPEGAAGGKDGDVVDAEFTEVKDGDKK